MAVLATLNDETLVIVARYPSQYLIHNGMLHYPDWEGVVRVKGYGPVISSADSYWDLMTIVDGDYDGPPFSGRTPWHQWDGPADASTSSSVRHSKLLRVTDEISSDYEVFQCVVRTKIYAFDAPQLYKRMFWWGLDGIFRLDTRATVLPVALGGQVTWGELLSNGVTWGDLLYGTWGRPTEPGLSVETIRGDVGSSAQRKFLKFNKKLRFRQVQFQVVFNTRGDADTAPARLFSLHAEVTQAQTVSKAIS